MLAAARPSWKRGLFATALLALVIASVLARTDACRSGCAAQGSGARARGLSGGEDPPTGAVLLDLDDDATLDDRAQLARQLARAIAPFGWPSGALGELLSDEAELFRVVPPASEVDDVLAALAGDARVEAVEVERTWAVPEIGTDAVATPPSEAATTVETPRRFHPDDPYYRYQWHLDQIGMPEAWTISRGEGVVVAVIDTGVAFRDGGRFLQAPDLARTAFVPGWDFVSNDPDPDDEHGHGTHVAGTIAQSTNNGLGVAGVAPAAAIMPLRVLDAHGAGGWGAIAAAIRWAADHGAQVINLSLGGRTRSRAVERAIEYAHRRGVVVVAAAGNAARSEVAWPARHEHVIAVGAVRFDRTLAFYSSHGVGLDLVAPGGDLRVDQNEDGMPDGVLQNTLVRGDPRRFDYVAYQGTSMAAPHVAGVAALVMASGVDDPDAVERLLRRSAIDLQDRPRYGAGLVQASAALRAASTELGALRGGLAGALALGVLLALRRRGRLAVGVAGTSAFAFAVAGGLGALPWDALGMGALDAMLTAGGPGLGVRLVGRSGALLALSALVPLSAVAVLLHVRKARPLLAGLCLGTAAFLVLEAVSPTLRVGVLPGPLVGPWLVANGALAVWLGRQVALRG